MGLAESEIQSLATDVDDAAVNAAPIVMLTTATPSLSLVEAYDIQRASMALRNDRGDEVIGLKMGLTSRAKMEQMGVHEQIYGHLTRSMRLEDGGMLSMASHVHPRVEPEVAFLLGTDLEGPVTPAEALLSVDGVCAALEIIDSRYKDFKFTLIDVVADNASSSRFVLGSTVRFSHDVDLGNLGMVMEINGKVVQTGSSAAIFDHPAKSLAQLANMLAERGEHLPAGSIVLAGGATAAVALSAGDVVALRVDSLGGCGFSVRPDDA